MVLKFLSKQRQKLVLILLAFDVFSRTINALAKSLKLCVHLIFLHFERDAYPVSKCPIKKTPDLGI